jgi:serine/threonine protein kinase
MGHLPAQCPGIAFTYVKPRAGSAGTFVYQGVLDGKVVAVKQVSELNSKLFDREGEILSSLAHPNIVAIARRPHFHQQNGERIGCLVMPWFENTIEELIGPALQVEETLTQLILPLAEVLSYAHSRNKTHRDLKPSNILLGEHGEPIIADWGVGKDYRESKGATVGVWSSKGYTPSKPGDGYQLDVYCFGVIAVELLAGQKSLQEFKRIELLSELNISENLKEILAKCLESDPKFRFRRMVEVSNSLVEQISLDGRSKSDRILELELSNFDLIKEVSKLLKCKIDEVNSKVDELLSSQRIYSRNLNRPLSSTIEDSFTLDDFWLVAETFELRVECQPFTGKMMVLEFRETELIQDLPLQKPPFFSWRVGANANPLQRQNYILLRQSREKWDKEGSQDQSGRLKNGEEARLIDEWNRTLDVLELIKRGKGLGIQYSTESEDSVGGFKTLRLQTNFEESLEGTSWACSNRPDIVLTVLNHKGFQIVVRAQGRKIKQLPKSGEIIPALDSGTKVALARKRDALTALSEGTTANPKLGKILSLNYVEPKPRPVEIEKWFSSNFDQSKKKAIGLALGSENIALIQGPPGTGKTEFIAELIQQILAEKPSATILLVSQTHVALDNALDRLTKKSKDVRIARIGKSDNQSISAQSQLWLPEQQLKNWAANLEKNSNAFLIKYGMKHNLEAHHAAGLVALHKIVEIYEMLGAETGNGPEEQTNEDDVPELSKPLNIMLGNLRVNFSNQLPEYDFPQTLKEAKRIIDQILGYMKVGRSYRDLLKVQARWITKLQASGEVERLFLRSRSVLAGTCVGFLSNPLVREFEYDVCIIDEASRATSTEMLVPFSKARKIVLVGDTRQLGPSNIEFLNQEKLLLEHDLSLNQLNNNVFRTLNSTLPRHSITSLNRQYRMLNPIGSMISDVFYDGAIKSEGPEPFRAKLTPSKPVFTPIRWIDTSQLKNVNHEEPKPGLVHNIAEANIVVKEILQLESDLISEIGASEKPLTLMVIAPYRAQVSLIEGLLKDVKFRKVSPEVLTIDSVQGREADIVFYSAVRSSDKPKKIGFLTPERFNVALSRGRQTLTIVGNFEFWSLGDSKMSEICKYVNELETTQFVKVQLHDS